MANGLNKVQLIGHLGRDPEVRVFDGNRKRVTFSLATSRTYKSKEGLSTTKTDWHNIILWTPIAEIAERFLTKGSQVYIEGEINNRSYETNTGEKRYITEINGRQLLLLGRATGTGTGTETETNTAMESQASTTPSSAPPNAATTTAPADHATNQANTPTKEEADNTLPF